MVAEDGALESLGAWWVTRWMSERGEVVRPSVVLLGWSST